MSECDGQRGMTRPMLPAWAVLLTVMLLLILLSLAGCSSAPDESVTPAGAIVVGGGDGGKLPQVKPADEHVDATVLNALWDDMAKQGAQALLVARHGHLLFERYAQANAATRVDGGPMSSALLAMVTGVARADQPALNNDAASWDPAALQASVANLAGGHYERYLSQRLWQPLDATAGYFTTGADQVLHADCCFHARAVDWLRVGLVLLDQGRVQGEQRVPAAWVDFMLRPTSGDPTRGFGVRLAPRGYALRNIMVLPGPARTRLWLVPALQLAVLRVDPHSDGPDRADALTLDPILRAVSDRPAAAAADLLDELVPGH